MNNVIQFQPTSTPQLGPVGVGQAMQCGPFEPFVDEYKVAAFLCIEPRRVLEMARKGAIPAHPLGEQRRTWRFRISEIDAHFSLSNQKRVPATVRLAVPVTQERRRVG